MTTVQEERTGVLVLGGGGAALRAAIAAAEFDLALPVLLATKGALGRSGVTAAACSDRMAFHATLPTTEPREAESWRRHADDTYHLGGCVSDYDLAVLQAREAAAAFEYLDRLGVPWVRRPDGTVDQFVTDGSRYARACYTGPYTANHIEAALVRRARQLPNIRVLENVCATDLLLAADRQVAGALLLSEDDAQCTAVYAGAVVLATGGAGQVYHTSVFPADCTGDGYAMAYRAGADLVNMEFIQIGLCSVATGLAMSGSMMRAMPRIINDRGEEFLQRYLDGVVPPERVHALTFDKGASWPVSYEHDTRIPDVAVTYERSAGRRVLLDYSRNPDGFAVAALPERIRDWYQATKGVPLAEPPFASSPLSRLMGINRPSVEWLQERGLDLLRGEMVEVAPAVQHFQGGVKIRLRAETSLPGLFAAGEAAGGQHGANRPGGNALMDSQVFGRIAGENAARTALSSLAGRGAASPAPALEALDVLLRGTVPAREVREEVQHLMSQDAGVVRTAQGLERALKRVEALSSEAIGPGHDPLAYAVETRNILLVAEMVLRAALMRDESRGPHLRFARFGDFELLPSRKRWTRYIRIHRRADTMALSTETPVPPP